MKLYKMYEKAKFGDFSPKAKQYINDFMFVRDKMLTDYKKYTPNDMLGILIQNTSFDKRKLKKFIKDWYANDDKRHKIIYKSSITLAAFEGWFNKYIDVDNM